MSILIEDESVTIDTDSRLKNSASIVPQAKFCGAIAIQRVSRAVNPARLPLGAKRAGRKEGRPPEG